MGTIARWFSLRSASPEIVHKRLASLKTWWVIAILLCLALLFGRLGGVLLFTLVSILAVREYLSLTGFRSRDWRVVGWIYAIVGLNYLVIYFGWRELFVVLVPLCGLMLLSIRMALRDKASGFLGAAGSTFLGMMLMIYCISHAPLLLTLPDATNPVAGAVGWFLYLIVLTESSDIVQALVGRRLGRHQVAPVLSPHKTWEGLVAGIVFTSGLAVLLAPLLTPLADTSLRLASIELTIPYLPAVLAGMLISIVGYFGDLTISGIKRDIGVKDSGTMLPGQGGILDRIDSLMFSAPAFYYFVFFVIGV